MADENGSDRKPTERVILELITAIEIPADATVEQIDSAVKALSKPGRQKPRRTPAWREVGNRTATSKLAAIEAYAGKPGTPEAKVGVFRAPTVTSWKGAAQYDAPPAPLVERRVIE